MSRGAKIGIIVGAVLIVAMCGFGGLAVYRLAKGVMITDPVKIRAVSAQIAEYELPPGHHEQFAQDLLGMKTVSIEPERGKQGMRILLMQFGMAGVKREQMEAQLRAQSAGFQGQMTGTETVTIRGQPVELQVFRRSDGGWMRRGAFQGRGGTCMLQADGPESARADFEKFLKSMK